MVNPVLKHENSELYLVKISAIISNKGTIVSYIEKGVSSILEGEVKLINLVSFYNKAGYLFAYIFTFFIIALYLISLIWKKYKQS